MPFLFYDPLFILMNLSSSAAVPTAAPSVTTAVRSPRKPAARARASSCRPSRRAANKSFHLAQSGTSAISLVDCGTFLWFVVLEVDARESGNGSVKTFILKTAWRPCARLAESTIHEMIYSGMTESTSYLTNLDGVAVCRRRGYLRPPTAKQEGQSVESS